jgi:hypothetical protein
MKKLMLTMAGLMMAGLLYVNGQELDTVPSRKKDTLRQEANKYQHNQESFDLRDMTKVKATDVPAALHQTLQGSEYKGWDAESSTIYKSKTGNLYTVEIRDGNKTKVFHFDGDGKPIVDYN